MTREDLSLGERVHLASKDLRKIMNPSIWAALAGLGLIGIAVVLTYNTTTILDEYGYHEHHYNSAEGPTCNPLDQLVTADSEPARIVVLEGDGAEKAGLRSGDVIVRINGVQTPDAKTAENWRSFLTEVRPGDTVEVQVTRGGQNLSFMVETTQGKNGEALIGFLIPYSCEEYFFFSEEEKQLTLDSIRQIDRNLSDAFDLYIVFGSIFGYFLIWTIWKGRKLRKEIDDWEDTYLDQHYILTFETNTPKGNTNGEKIFNMAQAVFPELRQKNNKPEKWKGVVMGENGYEFDCYQETNEKEQKYFIAKHFGKEKIDLEKIQELCNMAMKGVPAKTLKEKWKKFGSAKPAFRVICVGENYDEKLLKDRSRQREMDKLEFEYPVDLILEKAGNYQVLWADL